MNRQNLEKLYLVYIRPIFEYACEVWDNCGLCYSNKLESLQVEAARIITGLPVFTKTELLYAETGWESLSVRRRRRKLQLFYNMQNNNAPKYLCDTVPPSIQSTTVYPLRNGADFIVPFCRLSLTKDSFIPSTVREWNKLDLSVRNLDSVTKFKNALRRKDVSNIEKVPRHYFYGPRKLNVILTQLRCSASFLNKDLYRVNILSNPSCSCGSPQEDAYHYFFVCTRYSNLRDELFQNLNWVTRTVNTDLLTNGSKEFTHEENVNIFKHVFKFIKGSKRFVIV